jgi:hypothetical protein
VQFATAAGDITDLATNYGQAGFDQAVVVHLFDTARARAEAMDRLAPGRRPKEPAHVTAAVDEAVAESMRASNRWVADTGRDHPLVEVLASLDPTVLTRREIVDHLTELADAGVRGVKLHPVSEGILPIDPRPARHL